MPDCVHIIVPSNIEKQYITNTNNHSLQKPQTPSEQVSKGMKGAATLTADLSLSYNDEDKNIMPPPPPPTGKGEGMRRKRRKRRRRGKGNPVPLAQLPDNRNIKERNTNNHLFYSDLSVITSKPSSRPSNPSSLCTFNL